MNTTTEEKQTIDLTQFSPAALKAALKKVEKDKDLDRQAYKKLVEETTPKAFLGLANISEQLSNAKRDVFQHFINCLKLKNEVYGITEGQQSHTFSDKNCEISIGFRVTDGWDDTVSAGIEKVNNFISTLSTNEETAALVKLVFGLMKKDAKGNLKASRVLDLQKLTADFDNEEFTDGVDIIAKSYKPVRSSWFIDAALIKSDGKKVSVPLSMSAVDFPADFSFDFLSNNIQKKAEPNG